MWGKGTTHCITEKILWVKFLWKANSLHSPNVAIDYIRYARNTDFAKWHSIIVINALVSGL